MKGKLLPLRRVDGEPGEFSDEALLAACATGDEAALGALFDRFHEAVYRFVARLPGTDAQSCDDLVQATFLEVQRAAGRFRGASAVKTWILGVAANLARHHQRGEERRRAYHGRYAESPTAAPERPDDALERRRFFERIAAALAALPHDLRVAFIFCDLDGIPGAEAARALRIPEGTLWRRLHEARKAVRGMLERGPA